MTKERIGQQFGPYRLLHRLGEGTFGTTYLAEHIRIATQAVIKIRQLPITSQDDLHYFTREMRLIAHLRHPHIMPILDWYCDNGGYICVVMEHAAGGSLRNLHPRGSKLPWETIDSYVQYIASALQYAHDHHIVHCNLKPENVLLRNDGTVLISDFVIAVATVTTTRLRGMQEIANIATYMAPEQINGKPKPTSDQYSLAVIVYEWLTGQLPFQGRGVEIILHHLLDVPPSLQTLRPEMPIQVEQVILRALAKTPEERFPTITQFAQALHSTIQNSPSPPQSVLPCLSSSLLLHKDNSEQLLRNTNPLINVIPNSGVTDMDTAFVQAFQAAENPEDKAALIAEASLSAIPNEVALIARQCILFHWFNLSIVQGLLLAAPLHIENAQDVYRQITSLPFVEQLPWGATYQDLTRQGLLKHYTRTQPELLRTAATLAAPLYRALADNDRNTVEALFCSIISGDVPTSDLYLNTLLEQAMGRQDWQQMEGLFCLQEEAEQLPFVEPLPRTEHYWMLRSIVDRVQSKLDAALIDYDHVLNINPNNALVYLNRSIIHTQLHHHEQAQADYHEALRLDPLLVQTYIDGGILPSIQGHGIDTLGSISSKPESNIARADTRSDEDSAFFDQRSQLVTAQYNAASNRHIGHLHSSQPRATQSYKNRQVMLKRVRTIWIEGLLHRSLEQTALITLGFQVQPNAVSNPLHLVFERLNQHTYSVPAGTSITEVYDEARGELLILGEPGSGKTTLLLELAQDLLGRAEDDDTYPIPVVFNLSSWTQKRQPLDKWLIDEMYLKYLVPRKVALGWINTGQLLPLLDGFDEVGVSARERCIQAINHYHQNYLGPIVVCSRKSEYLEQEKRFLLQSAVVIQPLTVQQIDDYLPSAGDKLAVIRTVLHQDTMLQELARTPLMLNVLMLAYEGNSVKDVLPTGSREAQLRRIFEVYVHRMLTRRGVQDRYTIQQTTSWLAWLARQLIHHNQTIFYLEQMQPDWLSGRSRKFMLSYHIVVRLIVGLVAGLAVGLISGQFFGIIGGLLGGLAAGLIGSIVVQNETRIQPAEVRVASWANMKSITSGFLLGVGGILGSTLGSSLSILGVLGGMLSSISIAGLFSGEVSSSKLDDHQRFVPNEGIQQSVRNSIAMMFISGLIGTFAIGLTAGIAKGLTAGLAVGLVAGLVNDGIACIQHFVLWLFLRLAWGIPMNYSRFLDYAVNRLLLHRVGRGYIFTHRSLLDYFASLEDEMLNK